MDEKNKNEPPTCLDDASLRNSLDYSLNGTYKCRVLRVIEGDTVRVAIQFKGDVNMFTVRLADVDTPELYPRLDTIDRDAVIKRAHKARDFVVEKVLGHICDLHVIGLDKFGRLIAYLENDGMCIGNELLLRRFGERTNFPVRESRISSRY